MSKSEETVFYGKNLPDLTGNYVLVYHIRHRFEFKHKTLGNHQLNAGWYFYSGSAHGSGGLKSRIQRHLASDRKVHWHIDYLKKDLVIQQVWFNLHEENQECVVVRTILSIAGARVPIQGFGSSDCHEGCPSHLISFYHEANPELVYQTLNTAGLHMIKIFP